ncbi:amino acid permease [Fictibacillus nanhaiensis]|uniref:amino acid permease n=1 Tax=Fictibacillus nanhaiensis TaxID=742169 RepID=UPI002E251053|nr:amino acid permease [Fictibacillus nanhaiensis]MED1866040.1 amino acid permease [Fictibacillus nanhaiensis]
MEFGEIQVAYFAIDQDWAVGFIPLGAIIDNTTVLIIMMFGQTRSLYAMSRDGLLSSKLSAVHPRTKVPLPSPWTTGLLVALFVGFVPLDFTRSSGSTKDTS